MRLAFYAPMKHPRHPLPSGERELARHFLAALSAAGFSPELASRFRAYDGTGDSLRQRRIRQRGERVRDTLLRRLAATAPAQRPRLWFTYHLYHKAPDWLGPAVARRLDIPYVVAEASYAGKQRLGPWREGWAAAGAALDQADLIISINPADDAGIRERRGPAAPLLRLPPFIDVAPFAAARPQRAGYRAAIAARHGLAGAEIWLIAAGMMRTGVKLASYRLLAAALARLHSRPWRLLLMGDGPERGAVEAAFAPVAQRCTWLGQVDRAHVPCVMAAADLAVWPSVGEPFGLVHVEAAAAGLPSVAVRTPGTASIIADGRTGRLVAAADSAAFAHAIAQLLDHDHERQRLGAAAAARARRRHHLAPAARRLRAALTPLLDARGRLR